ncbi:Mov34-domain-containing protein [Microstroma glucosiphilum]|uniref:COP9 signalosome complex subunit 5 n=1 Tax=Pseudomicrostroma glucosiphilum TaxID=1684307 RepID=A0A316U5V2_9BASI|nr:Mov34-domain-containing protein [Pseudomicrostroma glucosiphilum]PWN20609.1 Mov34-domain-containing protein [Pseudomicrostroma glucosiphilum]
MSAVAGPSTSSSIAQKTFELNNDMITLDPHKDAIFHFDNDQQKQALNAAPWKKDPHFFHTVRISAVALIKMVMHARSGGIYEIMGLMQGKVDIPNKTLYVMDAFALPVQGTETRVNAQNEAYEYMVEYLESSKQVGRLENAIGWYHSHPGYGCWLSGIDVNTQMTNQQFQDPFVAIVIDPNRTISAGRVDIGAFRTYPANYKPPNASSSSEYQSIPLSKIEDFGVHANAYYPLKVEHFKSSLDERVLGMLWEKYWVATLSQSPLVVNREYATGQVRDLAAKMGQVRRSAGTRSATTLPLGRNGEEAKGDEEASESPAASGGNAAATSKVDKMVAEARKREEETPLAKVVRDGSKISAEAQHGLLTQVLKDVLFNRSGTTAPLPPL